MPSKHGSGCVQPVDAVVVPFSSKTLGLPDKRSSIHLVIGIRVISILDDNT